MCILRIQCIQEFRRSPGFPFANGSDSVREPTAARRTLDADDVDDTTTKRKPLLGRPLTSA
ncbi:hypothetical protein BRD01_13400 [Halobacteriales archaeon QS_8_65_32]|nr:MAG: hypothetical protein BRD01_13400 [Halobacteriales archaeon QS_8_65_32]